MSTNPVVSVVMISYGHEKYIRQAIESVLLQQCNFEVELILANDCSPDKTDEVVQDLLKKHRNSSWVHYYHHERNLGMMPNFIFALQQCSGKYIALCEGDDYWIDEYKLQKQVDFLNQNPQYVIHSGVASIQNETMLTQNFIGDFKASKSLFIEDFYHQNNIVTCTVLYRNVIKNYPDNFTSVTFGDWYLYAILLQQTNLKAYRSLEVFSVYRIHDKGVMKSLSNIKNIQLHIDQILTIKKFVGYKNFSSLTTIKLNNYFTAKFKIELSENKFLDAINTFLKNLKEVKDFRLIKNYINLIFSRLIKKSRL